MIKKLAIGLGLFGIAFIIGSRVKTIYNAIRYTIQNLRFVNFDLSSGNISLAFDFVVYNPTMVSVTIDSLNGGIYLQGQQIGIVNMPVGRELRAKESTGIPVLINVLSTDAIAQIVNLLSYSTMQQWTINLSGTLVVNGHDVAISYNYPLSNI